MNKTQKEEVMKEVEKLNLAISHLISSTEIVERFNTIKTTLRKQLRNYMPKSIIDTICKEAFMTEIEMQFMMNLVGKSPKDYEQGGK